MDPIRAPDRATMKRRRSARPWLTRLLFFLALAAAGVMLAAPAWKGVKYMRLAHELSRVRVENRRLLAENKQFRQEIERLVHDPAYLEEVARKEYGLLKKNEVLYRTLGGTTKGR